MSAAEGLDLFDGRLACTASGVLAEFNLAGVLAAADVHVARTLGRLGAESDEDVLLAAALAVRAPRLGHVHVDLRRIRESAAVESDEPLALGALPWPDPEAWLPRVAGSRLVGGPDAVAPLRLEGTRLYLDRYWAEERQVAGDLLALNRDVSATVDDAVLSADLARLYGGEDRSRQQLAAATSVLRRLSVIAGGPGTGKTTTVARVLALLYGQARAAQRAAPLIALAAPTGKAAARLEQAVHEQARSLPVDDEIRERLLELEAATLHRLLGRRPDSNSRFRHDRHRHLPFDAVVVDETSMVPLSLMARLIEALRPSARLVLVGDPGQLASIEAGAVLGDIVGPAADRLVLGPSARTRLKSVTRLTLEEAPPAQDGIGDAIVVLDRLYRFGGAIAEPARPRRKRSARAA